MKATGDITREQEAIWNGTSGEAWVEAQDLLDGLFEPFARMLVDAVAARSGRGVLDVGCGAGGTTIAIARQLGERVRCTGIDISEPMLAAARGRAERDGVTVAFVRADAETHAFEPASFDAIVSRFGVMFFHDPVRAFTNLRQAATEGAGLQFLAWRSAAENPFMTAAERAAAPVLPGLDVREADGPGQFAFADRGRVETILRESGWRGVEIEPVDVGCALPETKLERYVTKLGPVGRALGEVDEHTRARVMELVRPAFDSYREGGEIRFTAACWTVRALNGDS